MDNNKCYANLIKSDQELTKIGRNVGFDYARLVLFPEAFIYQHQVIS